LGWRFATGAPLVGDRPGRLSRPARAGLRWTLTALGVGAWLAPVLTAAVLAALAVGAVVGVVIGHRRAADAQQARRQQQRAQLPYPYGRAVPAPARRPARTPASQPGSDEVLTRHLARALVAEIRSELAKENRR
jgi:hypothetical protein